MKVPRVGRKNSISETGTSIFCLYYSFIPMNLLNLASNISSAVDFYIIPLTNTS